MILYFSTRVEIKNAPYTHWYKRRRCRGPTLIYHLVFTFRSRAHFHSPPLPMLAPNGPGSL